MNHMDVTGQQLSKSRRRSILGRATWTIGTGSTVCDIPWSTNHNLTVAVSQDSPFHCGDTLQVTNLAIPSLIIRVIVVDRLPNFPTNEIVLRRGAFIMLGGSQNPEMLDSTILDVGIINVGIEPVPEQATRSAESNERN